MVGRPREFDVDQALNAAMEAFWAKGYEATSMADLMSATGLHKGSLYQAFGDKHTLFIQALKSYLAEMRASKNSLLSQADTPLDGLRDVAHGMIDIVDDDSDCPKGCLAINALVELGPHDAEVAAVMKDHMARMHGSVEQTITRAQAAGQLDKDHSPQTVASLLLTFLAGLGTTMKGGITKEQAHRLLDAQLESLL